MINLQNKICTLLLCSTVCIIDSHNDVLAQTASLDSTQNVIDRDILENPNLLNNLRRFDRLDDIAPREPTEQDVILLREHNPLYMRVISQGGYSSNIERTSDDQNGLFFDNKISVGLDTVVDQKYYVYGEVGVRNYTASNSDVDYDDLSGSIGAIIPMIDDVNLRMNYTARTLYDTTLDEQIISYHSFNITPQWNIPLSDDTAIGLSAFYQRNLSNKSDFDTNSFGLSSQLRHQLSPKTMIWTGLQGNLIQYDGFFSNILSEDRVDHYLNANLGARYRLTPFMQTFLRVDYHHNDSTIDSLSYDGFSALGGMIFTWDP